MSTPGKSSPRALAAYAAATLVWICFACRFDFVCDDAFISFRYAHHLAEGNGLVYNPLREVPVEGYSNFLWVIWLSLFERFDFDVTVAARWSSLVAGWILLVGTMRLAEKRLSLSADGLAATGLFLASLPAFCLWSTGGLATMPAALAIFGVLWALHGDEAGPKVVPAVVCAAAATLMRADGVGYVGLVLAGTLAGSWLDSTKRQNLRISVAVTAAAVATVFIAHTVWRHGYYGEWVPNTAKIKAGLTTARLHRGLLYIGAFLVALPAVAVGTGIGLRRWREGPAPLLLTSAVLIVGSFGYAVWVGGDFMPFGRFLVPALPAIALLFAWGWSRLKSAPAWTITSLCVLASSAEVYDKGPGTQALREMLDFRFQKGKETPRKVQSEVERWRDMKRNAAAWDLWGRALALHTNPSESIIIGGMGAIGYRAKELLVYDTYGLVTPEVAEVETPKADAAPGHELKANLNDFLGPELLEKLPQKPTCWGAFVTLNRPLSSSEEKPEWLLVPFDEQLQQLLKSTKRDLETDYAVSVELVHEPLKEADGFPKDTVLHFFRFKHK